MHTYACACMRTHAHFYHAPVPCTRRDLCDIVVASVYVNPTQFSANEDFDVYPRDAVR